ncbi:MAG: hypothetical protein U0176_19750 [Bacteroidia bacterium]
MIGKRLLNQLLPIALTPLVLACSLGILSAQDDFERLYRPADAVKQKLRTMTVEFFAATEGADSIVPDARVPDYRERYYYDAQGRVDRFEATNPNIRLQGSMGPQLMSRYEYGPDGRTWHRHDTTVFGSSGESIVRKDSTGRMVSEVRVVTGQDLPTMQRTYYYDVHGRLEKHKTVTATQSNPTACKWNFFIHDTHSFNATNLSPQEMARCQCNLEYLDEEGRSVRRISYDSVGTIVVSTVLNYDRTGKPIRIEQFDKTGKSLGLAADVIYGRNGRVDLELTGPGNMYTVPLSQINHIARAFVVEGWFGYRLLRQLRVRQAGREWARYVFSYDLR